MFGLVLNQPLDIIFLYVTVAVAFWIVLVAEGAPLIAGLRRSDPEKTALKEEVARLRREREDRPERFVANINPELLTSRATIRLSGPTYEMVLSENVSSLTDVGVGELQINWAVPYRDYGYQLFITPNGCHLGRHSKTAGSVGMWFIPLDGLAPEDPIEVDVLAVGERA